jgi:hypothetical protein
LREALQRVAPGGTIALYTGAAICEGQDWFRRTAEPLCREAGASFQYEELDPDVFGSELSQCFYDGVERLAAVGLLARLPE